MRSMRTVVLNSRASHWVTFSRHVGHFQGGPFAQISCQQSRQQKCLHVVGKSPSKGLRGFRIFCKHIGHIEVEVYEKARF